MKKAPMKPKAATNKKGGSPFGAMPSKATPCGKTAKKGNGKM